MSASNTSSYPFAGRQISIYMGMPILIAGLVGEMLNTIVFLSLRTFRDNSCAFYLTVMSFVNIGQLLFSLLPQIMIRGFEIDWTQTSIFYCKFRLFMLQLCTLMSCTCMCLATIDQFFATCFTHFWQRLSNIKLARVLILIYFVVWILHGVPHLLYLEIIEISSTNELLCTTTNRMLTLYFIYGFVVTLAGFLPIMITISFGLLAYRNVQRSMYQAVPLIRRELDKQLTVMVLVEVVFNCLATTPYIVLYIIMRDPTIAKDPFIYSQLLIVSSVLYNVYFLHYASPFYIYVCVSERFRRQLVYVLFEMHLNRWRQPMLPINQISP